MSVRRGPAIVLSLMLSAAALATTPPAFASDGGAAKGDKVLSAQRMDENTESTKKDCDGSSEVKLRVTVRDNGRLETVSTVWSDDDDVWSWKLKHEGDVSDEGEVKAKDADKSFKIIRTMVDFNGPDTVNFRAENTKTGEVCRVTQVF